MPDRTRRTLMVAALAWSAWPGLVFAEDSPEPSAPTLSQRLSLYGEEAQWSIHRKNRRIGTHRMTVSQSGDSASIEFETDITVRVLKVPVYRFNYQSTERWSNGELATVSTRVTEKGDTTQTELDLSSDVARAIGPAGSVDAANVNFATNHWHSGVLGAQRVFNTITGVPNNVVVTTEGTGELTVGSRVIPYTAYRYSGELELVSWYDDEGRWLGMRFDGEDGSIIEYRKLP